MKQTRKKYDAKFKAKVDHRGHQRARDLQRTRRKVCSVTCNNQPLEEGVPRELSRSIRDKDGRCRIQRNRRTGIYKR